MKQTIRTLLMILTLYGCSRFALAQLPVLTGTVPGGVRTINTDRLLARMNHGAANPEGLVLVAAHRGYWINAPENSDLALTTAFDAGVEAIEIDLRTTSDGVLVLSHDADLVKETTGTGLVSNTPFNTIGQFPLRDRKGNSGSHFMLRFVDALNILKNYQSSSGSSLFGPVIIADLKDLSPWPAYQQAVREIAATLPAQFQRAVVLKIKMKNIPSIAAVQAELAAHPGFGHILPVINPEDATANPNGFDGPDWEDTTGAGDWSPFSMNFQSLLKMAATSPNFVQQFELNELTPTDGSSQYVAPNGPLVSFATYYEPKFYPEGVSTIKAGNTLCCYIPTIATDMRGVLSFSLFNNTRTTPGVGSGVSLITSDNLAETLNFLVSVGKRDVSEIQ